MQVSSVSSTVLAPPVHQSDVRSTAITQLAQDKLEEMSFDYQVFSELMQSDEKRARAYFEENKHQIKIYRRADIVKCHIALGELIEAIEYFKQNHNPELDIGESESSLVEIANAYIRKNNLDEAMNWLPHDEVAFLFDVIICLAKHGFESKALELLQRDQSDSRFDGLEHVVKHFSPVGARARIREGVKDVELRGALLRTFKKLPR